MRDLDFRNSLCKDPSHTPHMLTVLHESVNCQDQSL